MPLPHGLQCGLVNGTVTGLDAAAGDCVPCADPSCIECTADFTKCTQARAYVEGKERCSMQGGACALR